MKLPMQNPQFIVYCGPMWSAKTTSMLLRLERFELQGRKVKLFKPNIDERYDAKFEVVTHSGWKRAAVPIKNAVDILKEIENDPPEVIALDEAFMVKDSHKVLVWLFKTGVTIVVSSLDLSFKGVPFKEVEKMLSWATEVHKCAAVCKACGSDAFYTYRKNDDNEDIIVGGAELYESRCFRCHPIIDERPGDYE
jgi:thymidine kinase